ncbi:MAG TPA: sensor histidine kinase [Puia sp.]
MKRLLLHIAFWVLYTLQDLLMSFTWVRPSLPGIPDGRILEMATVSTLVTLLPKLLISYFLLLVSIKKIVAGKTPLYRTVAEIIGVFALCILISRAISTYYIFPQVYQGLLGNSPWLEVRSILVATMDFGFIAGLAASVKFVRIQLAGKEKEKSLVKAKLEAELKFLRNQTNPHFLMNTLNNIYALARKKSDDTAEVVMKLSELLRFMLYESDGHFISLTDEVKVLEDYLDLEMMRYNDRLTVSCYKEIDKDNYRITPRLLLPFIENAFKHGISETRFESFIRIDIKAKEGKLHFSIENTKENTHPGMPRNNIGLINVKRQLELTYREYELDVHNGGDIFSVNLSINLESHVEI